MKNQQSKQLQLLDWHIGLEKSNKADLKFCHSNENIPGTSSTTEVQMRQQNLLMQKSKTLEGTLEV